jgi:hypothetical protein
MDFKGTKDRLSGYQDIRLSGNSASEEQDIRELED